MKESPIRYFYDTEFIDDGRTIDLVSIGIVAVPDWAIATVGHIPPGSQPNTERATAAGVRTYYAINADVDLDALKGREWLVRNVLPHLPLENGGVLERYLTNGVVGSRSGLPEAIDIVDLDRTATEVKPRWVIANEVRDFILAPYAGELMGDEKLLDLELWADYAAYDHVALAQLWGPMIGLPAGIPMYTNDLQQMKRRLGSGWRPDQSPEEAHNALADAWYAFDLFVGLDALAHAE
jgi:3' exoribonuclease, RNase T-like